ncbi:MAG: hypothetical protein NTU53_02390 [Planctomycetota bacterium]|nr:hypothetical protein [Planctomycetota bacterium]
MALLCPVDAAMLERRGLFAPDIAAVVDEESMCHLTGGSAAFASELIYHGRAAFGRSGVPYGQYLLDDVLVGRVPARLHIFVSTWALSSAKRAALAARRTPGVVRAWCYAPGYLYPDRADVAGIQEVTGFAAKAANVATAEATPTEAGKRLGLAAPWGPKQLIRPLFSVMAAADETLATYSDGTFAVAVRRSEKGIDVFIGVPQLTPELVRALAKMAGVHMFTEGKATVWAAEGYIVLQAHETGPLVLNTGRQGRVIDALDGKTLGDGPELPLTLKKGEVRVFKYEIRSN